MEDKNESTASGAVVIITIVALASIGLSDSLSWAIRKTMDRGEVSATTTVRYITYDQWPKVYEVAGDCRVFSFRSEFATSSEPYPDQEVYECKLKKYQELKEWCDL